MSALAPEIRAFLDAHVTGTLGTTAPGGRVRQSLVYFARDGDRLLITTEAGRLKARDVARTGWASLCVAGGEPPFPSVALAGPASVLTTGIGPATAAVVQRILGATEPPDPQSDEALAGVGRVILAIDVERVGPVSYIEPAA